MDIFNYCLLALSLILNVILYKKYKDLECNKERRKMLKYRATVVFPEKDLSVEDDDDDEDIEETKNVRNNKQNTKKC